MASWAAVEPTGRVQGCFLWDGSTGQGRCRAGARGALQPPGASLTVGGGVVGG